MAASPVVIKKLDTGNVSLVNGEGEVAPFKPEQADEAMQHGWPLATPELVATIKANNGALGGVKATGEGILRGASFGLSDVAEKKLGLSTAENITARREAHPYLSTAGEIAGGVGSAAATGGLLGAAGLTGLGGALATGAITGGLQGGLGTFSDSLLNDKQIRGEGVAQHTLMGTLLGTVGAGTGEALGAGVRAVGRAAAGLSESLPGSAERFAVQALKPSGEQMLLLEEQGLTKDLGRKILEDGSLNKGKALANYGANKEALVETGKKVENALTSSEAPVSQETLGDMVGNLRKLGSNGEFETKPPV